MSENQTVTIMGKEYLLDSLDDSTLRMISLYKKWKEEGNDFRIAYLKSEGACRDIAKEIVARVEKKKETSPYVSTVTTEGTEIIEFKKN